MEKEQFTNHRISHFPRAAVIVTSKNTKEQIGAATISWCGVISSQPSVISISILPDSFTRNCIVDSREFVINIPDITFLKETNLIGSISGEWNYKMDQMRKELGNIFTLNPSKKINTPSINECYLNFECRVLNVIQVGLYDCFMGLVLNMECKKDLFSSEKHHRGHIDYNLVSPVFCLADEYWSRGEYFGLSTENKNHPHGRSH